MRHEPVWPRRSAGRALELLDSCRSLPHSGGWTLIPTSFRAGCDSV